jgi:predicted TIM-barrel fold metal-dependent hydrolase
MIIDVHGHNLAPSKLQSFWLGHLNFRGSHGRGSLQLSDVEIDEPLNKPSFRGKSLIDQVRDVGTDVQFISPRPISMGHHEQPEKIGRWYIEEVNNVIHRQCKLHPDLFRGVAGLPQNPKTSPKSWVGELERCVTELGFVGCLLNPDPGEGFYPPPPGLGDEYWYPLYEKLVQLDVPALIHSTQFCNPREPYTLHFINEESIAIISLLESRVFLDFPNLKLIVSHGGGAIPYQLGRFRAFYDRSGRRALDERFEESLRRLYFDTAVYSKEGLELLFKVVGIQNCLFGSERPGTGSARDPETGRSMDDLKFVIDGIDWLSPDQRQQIYEVNARRIFSRYKDQ